MGDGGVSTDGPAEAANSRAEPVDVHPPTWLERGTYLAIRGITLAWARLYLRLDVVGADKVPREQPFVLAPVHRSNLDFLLASFLIPRRMRYMGKASLWKYKVTGRFFTMLGAFPVHRGVADRAAMRTVLQVLEQNQEPVVMFPEGTRREGTMVEEVFDGPAYVGGRAGVVLVPVGIGGSDRAMPIGAKFIRPRKVSLVVGDPIEVAGAQGGRAPRRAVREASEKLKEELQRLYDEAQRRSG